jgi:hypothetical protein
MRPACRELAGCPAPAPTSERCSTDPQRRAWGADAVATANVPQPSGTAGHDFVAGLRDCRVRARQLAPESTWTRRSVSLALQFGSADLLISPCLSWQARHSL